MNELLFFSQIVLCVLFTAYAVRLGKEALTALIALEALLANLFVLKQTTLFGLSVTCSDVFAIGVILGLNLLQEKFTKESARRAGAISLLLLAFFTLMSQFHLLYFPLSSDATQEAYHTLLSPAPRLFIASLAVFFFVQQADLHFYSFLKKRLPMRFALRSFIALVASQLLDTVLFSLFGLYGLVSSLVQIIFFSFCVKLLIIFSLSPFLSFIKRHIQSHANEQL